MKTGVPQQEAPEIKLSVELTSNDGDRFRTHRLISVTAEIARLLIDAPKLMSEITGLDDSKGSLTVRTVHSDPPALLQLVVRDTWRCVANEDPGMVEFVCQTRSDFIDAPF